MRRSFSALILLLVLLGITTSVFTTQRVNTETREEASPNKSFTVKESISGNVATSSLESNLEIALVHVDPENTTASPGESFTVTVKIANVTNLWAFDLRFSWDPTVIKYVDHMVTIPVEDYLDGILHKPILVVKDEVNESGIIGDLVEPGTLYWLVYSQIAPALPFNGSGTIFTMTFDVIKMGTCELHFTSTRLTHAYPTGSIPHSVKNGHFKSVPFEHDLSVHLEAPVHIIPGTTVTLKATIRNVGLNDEVDVQLDLFIEGQLVESAVIPLLLVNSSSVMTHMWTPTSEGFHNVSAQAAPVSSETNTKNNAATQNVLVSIIIEVPQHFPVIQRAIDVASSGMTISVAPGIYYERPVINKPLTLLGQERLAIIDGQGNDIVVLITASNSVVDGFTVRNGHMGGIGVARAHEQVDDLTNVTITHNIVTDLPTLAAYGIYTHEARWVNISYNSISNAGSGLGLSRSDDNTLFRNAISNTSCGIRLQDSCRNLILGNQIWDSANGIEFQGLTRGSSNNHVERNNIRECGSAIECENVHDNEFMRNTLADNNYGITLFLSWNNTIYHNNFVDNSIQGNVTPSTYENRWHSNESEGNYWSDYTGEDLDGDGIGDTLLPHQGVDGYPLTEPWRPQPPGDVNMDNKVDINDIVLMATSFYSREGDPDWIPEADLAPLWGFIDIFDIATCAYHYGKTQQ